MVFDYNRQRNVSFRKRNAVKFAFKNTDTELVKALQVLVGL